jgi:hypothetical protein
MNFHKFTFKKKLNVHSYYLLKNLNHFISLSETIYTNETKKKTFFSLNIKKINITINFYHIATNFLHVETP